MKYGLSFLGKGEMGKRICSYHSMPFSLGSPECWPASLRNALQFLLHSKSPIILYWGNELICFYNDAFIEILDLYGKHPEALGGKAQDVWAPDWQLYQPLISKVMTSGDGSLHDHLFTAANTPDQLQCSCSYNPVFDENGQCAGVLMICAGKSRGKRELSEHHLFDNRFRNLVLEANIGMVFLRGNQMEVELVNSAFARMFNLEADQLMRKPIPAFFQGIQQSIAPIVRKVLLTGESVHISDHAYRLFVNGDSTEGYLKADFQPYKDDNGAVIGVMIFCQEVTAQVETLKRLKESEQHVKSIIASVPFPIGIYIGRDMRIQFANKAILDVFGKGDDVIGRPYSKVLPELHNQEIFEQLDGVFTSGVPFHAKYQHVDVVRHGKLQRYYFNYSFTPLYDSEGSVYGVMNTAADVTDLVLAHKDIEDSEARFRSMVLQSPVPIGFTKGREMILEIVNTPMLQLIEKTEAVIGKSLLEVLPHIASQPLIDILYNVFDTGKPYTGNEVPVIATSGGTNHKRFYDLSYTPIYQAGKVNAIIHVAVDVTAQTLARRKIEEAEEKTRLAIESAHLGTYEIDFLTDEMHTSPRFQSICGSPKTRTEFEHMIHPDDRRQRAQAFLDAYQSGNLNYEVRVFKTETEFRWVRFRGKVLYDVEHTPTRLLGVVADVTEQKLFTDELEKKVKQRTAELQIKNLELELMNRELEQFSYAASHDMQEPLRKVQTFSSFLIAKNLHQLDEQGRNYLEKISASVRRMKTIIDDLLNYSQQSQEAQEFIPTNLNEIIEKIEADLELVIQEKSATLIAEKLPVVTAAPAQMNQLFFNLLNNSLKFSKPGVPVEIRIKNELLTAEETAGLHNGDNHSRGYAKIGFYDNSIGFEQQYAEKIFELFKRLHNKTKYEGSGIGLGLCKKIVQNHKGVIWAESEPGKGSAFYIILPL